MENIGTKLIAGLMAALALVSCPAGAGAAGYRSLSAQLIKCAETNGFRKIAVLEFTARGGADKSDTYYAAEKIGLYLAGSRTTALIERALLERVLKETRLSLTGDGMTDKAEILRNMLSLDAVVTGAVFADGGSLRVLARLIELKSGRVLLAVEGEDVRLSRGPADESTSVPEAPVSFFPYLPGPQGAAGWVGTDASQERDDFRDAVSDSPGRTCGDQRGRVARLNSELVDAKARYWADKIKTPGFNMQDLTRNPGSEIGDIGVKAEFYKLLATYYKTGAGGPLDPEKKVEVAELIKMEERISDECGIN